MSFFALCVHVVNFIVMWSLPVFFFEKKDGKLNFSWAATALPFAVGPTVMLLVHFGALEPLALGETAAHALRIVGVVLAILSTLLVVWTWRTHRIRLSLWHMENDAPESLVTSGPYAWMRHPFYTSFLFGTLAAACHAPHLGLAATFVYAFVILDRTAAREERRLAKSQFGAQYTAYMRSTPRFMPWSPRRP